LKTDAAKFSLLIIHYFDVDLLGTGFESLSQADWLFFFKNKLGYVYISRISKTLLCIWGKTLKQEGSATRHDIERK